MKISDATNVTTGYQTRSGIEPDVCGSHFLLQIRDFDDSRREIDYQKMIRFSPVSPHREILLEDGDVVFLAKGARNFAAVVENLPSPCLAASYFFVLRPKPNVRPAYLAWFLNQEPAQQHFFRLGSTGAHMPVVRRKVLEDLEIPLPDLQTQERIIEIDTLARRQQALLLELAKAKRALTTAACLQAAEQFISIQDHR